MALKVCLGFVTNAHSASWFAENLWSSNGEVMFLPFGFGFIFHHTNYSFLDLSCLLFAASFVSVCAIYMVNPLHTSGTYRKCIHQQDIYDHRTMTLHLWCQKVVKSYSVTEALPLLLQTLEHHPKRNQRL